ncbi:MAG TPA: Lrp/AsnC family transcriptional regulator [Magnetospirillaceae bacterium]|jgi:DNA-binding Lrp family transcriptional regulator|nr:Lrp/AsnC family transcriptional regulator [Magnetospirillaceae bacterium]
MSRRIDDEKDAELLALLRTDARLPATTLANRLGVSRSAVQQRLARLERDGIIVGYTAVLGEKAAPNGMLQAHVLIEVGARDLPRLVTSLKGRHEVRRCYTASGQYDLLVMVEAASTQQLDVVLDWIGENPGVRRTVTSLLLSTKFER